MLEVSPPPLVYMSFPSCSALDIADLPEGNCSGFDMQLPADSSSIALFLIYQNTYL